MQGYPNAELVFHGIENIHVMRGALKDLIKVGLVAVGSWPRPVLA